MDIIKMLAPIFFVANQVLPISPLPNAGLARSATMKRGSFLSAVMLQRTGEVRLNQPPKRRVIGSSLRG